MRCFRMLLGISLLFLAAGFCLCVSSPQAVSIGVACYAVALLISPFALIPLFRANRRNQVEQDKRGTKKEKFHPKK